MMLCSGKAHWSTVPFLDILQRLWNVAVDWGWERIYSESTCNPVLQRLK